MRLATLKNGQLIGNAVGHSLRGDRQSRAW